MKKIALGTGDGLESDVTNSTMASDLDRPGCCVAPPPSSPVTLKSHDATALNEVTEIDAFDPPTHWMNCTLVAQELSSGIKEAQISVWRQALWRPAFSVLFRVRWSSSSI